MMKWKFIGRDTVRHCLFLLSWAATLMSTLSIDAKNDQAPINFEASNLTPHFYEKFQIGTHKMQGDDILLYIEPCQMSFEGRQALQRAILQRILLKNENELLKFWEEFTSPPQDKPNLKKSAIYLEIGEGKRLYSELFEKLIIAQEGSIVKNINCGSRKLVIRDDHNIQEELRNNTQLIQDFETGKAKFFIYHKLCNALVTLCYIEDDEFIESDEHPPFIVAESKKVLSQSHGLRENAKRYLVIAYLGGLCYLVLSRCVKRVKQIGAGLANILKIPYIIFGNSLW
ncbi:MAG: hypothetical protein LBB11_01320 [Puniceicoccales bacterium]|jgi:hypothetical protein|nr:hypothetical protein [Puniceicoccales bacterium]